MIRPIVIASFVWGASGCAPNRAPQQEHAGEAHDHGDDHGDEHDEAAGEERREQVVRLSPKGMSRSGIRIGEARAGRLEGAVEVPAEVGFNPDRIAHISPLVEGQILDVAIALGDRVEAGAPLARLRSVELGQARAELARTTFLLKVAKQNRDRQRQLRAEGISSQRALLEAELAYEQADAEHQAALSRLRVFGLSGGTGPDMDLVSPIDGMVVERHATRGENVTPADTLFIVADLDRVWVMGRVYEQQVAQVAEGMEATLTLNAYAGRSWTGTVDFIGATLDERTRTLPIRMQLDNPDGTLRPGLFGTLRLASGSGGGSAVVIPIAAVQTVENRTVVFVPLREEEGAFAAHPVTLGRESGAEVEVLEGLDAGDALVVEGAFVLKSELMRGQLGHGHAH